MKFYILFQKQIYVEYTNVTEPLFHYAMLERGSKVDILV